MGAAITNILIIRNQNALQASSTKLRPCVIHDSRFTIHDCDLEPRLWPLSPNPFLTEASELERGCHKLVTASEIRGPPHHLNFFLCWRVVRASIKTITTISITAAVLLSAALSVLLHGSPQSPPRCCVCLPRCFALSCCALITHRGRFLTCVSALSHPICQVDTAVLSRLWPAILGTFPTVALSD